MHDLDERNDSLTALEDEPSTYHNFDRLIRVASWATLLSWCFLGLGAIMLILNVVSLVQQMGPLGPGMQPLMVLASFLTSFLTVFISLFFFVLLQAVAEGIYVLLDIEDNTRPPDIIPTSRTI
jgi:hypothetical protein